MNGDLAVIRVCTTEDVDAAASLAARMGRIDALGAVAARMHRILDEPDHRLSVAERGGRLVGYAWAQNFGQHLRSGEAIVRMHDLFVGPPDRRSGVGLRLFGHVRAWAAEQGATYLQWQASEDALAFYRALGLDGNPCPDPGHPFFEVVLRPEST